MMSLTLSPTSGEAMAAVARKRAERMENFIVDM
jgi:hypothetical protein